MDTKLPHSSRKIDILLISFILCTALLFRIYKLNTPLADFHSFRQVDTAAVARNFVKNGFDLLHPRYDDFSNIQSGQENPEGYRMVEFPLYNALFGLPYKYLPITSLEIYGRLTSIFFSLVTITIVYYFVRKETNRLAAFSAALTYATFPFFVFFSRVVLPETTAVAFAMFSLFVLYISMNKKRTFFYYLTSIISFAIALLIKPTTGFYAIPLIYLFVEKYRFNIVKQWKFYVFFILSLIPFFLWRLHISKYPEGIPSSSWLLTQVNTFEGVKTIFFRPAFFRWIFYERLGVIIFGVFLSFFFILGILVKQKKYFLHSILISSLVYLFTFQGGNVQHEYYQTIIFPALAIFVGIGTSFIYENRKLFIHPIITYSIIITVYAASFLFSYYRVKDYYNYPHELTQIAKIIMSLTREEDKIVTDRTGDTTLLYLANRRGAPAVYKEPEELQLLGYKYLVTSEPGLIQKMKDKNYIFVTENDRFALIKLEIRL